MPSNENQVNNTTSCQELEKELAREVEYFERSGDSLGFACSAHEHVVYPGGTDLMGYVKWAFYPKCACGAEVTQILVQRKCRGWSSGRTLTVETWTKDENGHWINKKGSNWPKYSKEVYLRLAT